MHSEVLVSKDIKLKYTSLSTQEKYKNSIEELQVSLDLSQTELKASQGLLHQERMKARDLIQQLDVFKSKCDELEKYVRTMNEMISDKDRLISKIWDELLSLKKKSFFDEEKFLKNVDEENEIFEEGEVGVIQKPVGRSIILQPISSVGRDIALENQELKKIRGELVESQQNCKVLNERLKEVNELYVKLEIESQEIKEKLKFQTENSVCLTQQILKLNNDKESHKVNANLEFDELLTKLDACELEKKRNEKKFKEHLEEMNSEVCELKDRLEKLKMEKNSVYDECSDLKAELREMVRIIKKKDVELANLNIEVEEISLKSFKNESFTEKAVDINALIIENKDLKVKIAELTTAKNSVNMATLQSLLKLESFKFCTETQQFLIETFGEDSSELFAKIQSIISRYKAKIKSLKAQILQLNIEKSEKGAMENIRFSNYTSSTQALESPKKFISQSEVYMNQTPSFYSEIEKCKITIEKLKIAKRKAIAEKEQIKEDLAHAILNISELQTKIMTMQLEVKEHDFVAFLACEAALVEGLLANSASYKCE